MTVPLTIAMNVGGEQPLHPGAEVVISPRPEDQVKVVWHQAKSFNPPLGLGTRFPQSNQEAFAILVVPKNDFPTIPAVHHMINGAGIFNAQLAGHAWNAVPNRQRCQYH